MNKYNKQKLRHRQHMEVGRGKGGVRVVQSKGVKCMVTEGDLTLGGQHTAINR